MGANLGRTAATVLVSILGACAGPDAAPDASASPAPRATRSAQPSETPAPGVDPQAGGWELMTDAPFERIEMAVAAHDGAIWVTGGHGGHRQCPPRPGDMGTTGV
jgi:hypothetical protein